MRVASAALTSPVRSAADPVKLFRDFVEGKPAKAAGKRPVG
jgi:hypothetical protein